MTLGGDSGSVTIIGAITPAVISPNHGPSHTKEIVRTFWALSERARRDARHYPAVSWTDSFSGDVTVTAKWWAEEVNVDWAARRAEALALLGQAEELQRIVSLVGPEALSGEQRWTLESANLIKEAVLQQSALDEADSFASPGEAVCIVGSGTAGLSPRGWVAQARCAGAAADDRAGTESGAPSQEPLQQRAGRGYARIFRCHQSTFDKLGAEYEQQGEKTP